jgi:hypothetical protein
MSGSLRYCLYIEDLKLRREEERREKEQEK